MTVDTQTQWFADNYPGARIVPNVVVLHTTETTGWPGYEGGATAPNETVLPNLKTKTLSFRQHFPGHMSSRALRNEAGGVDTNTLNAYQIELVGTCSKAYADKYGGLYWPDAPDWALEQLAARLRSLRAQYPSLVLVDAAPRGWLPYPRSYGSANRQRMSFTEWRAARGIVGHQHVPENTHGDPGDFPIAELVELCNPASRPAAPSRVRRAEKLLTEALKRSKPKSARARAIRAALAAIKGRK